MPGNTSKQRCKEVLQVQEYMAKPSTPVHMSAEHDTRQQSSASIKASRV